MVNLRENFATTILTPQNFGALSASYDFTINPYAGCAFGCSYCYVPKFPNARHIPSEWGKWVEVKVNAPELLHRDRQKVFGSRIFFSSATDPYQYLELKYRLSRRCLQQLLKYPPAKLTMHTRSHLMLQDIDLLKAFGNKLSVGVSFTTDDEAVRTEFEPDAPSLKRRLELIRKLREQNISVYASIAPLLPCDPEQLYRLLSPFVDKAWVDTMHWTYASTNPWLLKKYERFFALSEYEKIAQELRSKFALDAKKQATEAALTQILTRRRSGSVTDIQPCRQLKLL